MGPRIRRGRLTEQGADEDLQEEAEEVAYYDEEGDTDEKPWATLKMRSEDTSCSRMPY